MDAVGRIARRNSAKIDLRTSYQLARKDVRSMIQVHARWRKVWRACTRFSTEIYFLSQI